MAVPCQGGGRGTTHPTVAAAELPPRCRVSHVQGVLNGRADRGSGPHVAGGGSSPVSPPVGWMGAGHGDPGPFPLQRGRAGWAQAGGRCVPASEVVCLRAAGPGRRDPPGLPFFPGTDRVCGTLPPPKTLWWEGQLSLGLLRGVSWGVPSPSPLLTFSAACCHGNNLRQERNFLGGEVWSGWLLPLLRGPR